MEIPEERRRNYRKLKEKSKDLFILLKRYEAINLYITLKEIGYHHG